jgi:hypothetical protein
MPEPAAPVVSVPELIPPAPAAPDPAPADGTLGESDVPHAAAATIDTTQPKRRT